jgi:hypothetical protein
MANILLEVLGCAQSRSMVLQIRYNRRAGPSPLLPGAGRNPNLWDSGWIGES